MASQLIGCWRQFHKLDSPHSRQGSARRAAPVAAPVTTAQARRRWRDPRFSAEDGDRDGATRRSPVEGQLEPFADRLVADAAIEAMCLDARVAGEKPNLVASGGSCDALDLNE